MRCRKGILLELVEGLQAKVVTKVFTKAFLQLVLEVLSPKVIPKCATNALLLLGHQPPCFVINICICLRYICDTCDTILM